MQFPHKFSRYVSGGAGTIALGADADPVDGTPPSNTTPKDIIFSHRICNINGWPCHRIAGVCRYIGAGAPPATLPITIWLWEAATEGWHILKTGSFTLGEVNFFDTIGPLDLGAVGTAASNMTGGSTDASNFTPGAETIYIQVDTVLGAPNGEYRFAFCADLTTGIL